MVPGQSAVLKGTGLCTAQLKLAAKIAEESVIEPDADVTAAAAEKTEASFTQV